jgi:hypothetical protein
VASADAAVAVDPVAPADGKTDLKRQPLRDPAASADGDADVKRQPSKRRSDQHYTVRVASKAVSLHELTLRLSR